MSEAAEKASVGIVLAWQSLFGVANAKPDNSPDEKQGSDARAVDMMVLLLSR